MTPAAPVVPPLPVPAVPLTGWSAPASVPDVPAEPDVALTPAEQPIASARPAIIRAETFLSDMEVLLLRMRDES
jgi:hypothetical protein